ncbi:hypothetical protein [Flammeovirga sp. SJP92]|uniref:hypothetical protein n=1 Tax=Flammeovirga sp. SJP92 TaxID=1775430 RepID=UPI000788204B|nr:hypothetical protein [Flammeovirga sp. SJP92]KXX66888.1 hypothetical protein AVL50_30630 [Flammeovirga sp. SJP92]
MWSDKYYYLQLFKDVDLSEEVSTKKVRQLINGFDELKSLGDFEFRNKKGFPFIQLLLLNVNSLRSWSEKDVNSEKTNLITIVCSKNEDFDTFLEILLKIAVHLNWTLVDEETDEGVENYIIWHSKKEK